MIQVGQESAGDLERPLHPAGVGQRVAAGFEIMQRPAERETLAEQPHAARIGLQKSNVGMRDERKDDVGKVARQGGQLDRRNPGSGNGDVRDRVFAQPRCFVAGLGKLLPQVRSAAAGPNHNVRTLLAQHAAGVDRRHAQANVRYAAARRRSFCRPAPRGLSSASAITRVGDNAWRHQGCSLDIRCFAKRGQADGAGDRAREAASGVCAAQSVRRWTAMAWLTAVLVDERELSTARRAVRPACRASRRSVSSPVRQRRNAQATTACAGTVATVSDWATAGWPSTENVCTAPGTKIGCTARLLGTTGLATRGLAAALANACAAGTASVTDATGVGAGAGVGGQAIKTLAHAATQAVASNRDRPRMRPLPFAQGGNRFDVETTHRRFIHAANAGGRTSLPGRRAGGVPWMRRSCGPPYSPLRNEANAALAGDGTNSGVGAEGERACDGSTASRCAPAGSVLTGALAAGLSGQLSPSHASCREAPAAASNRALTAGFWTAGVGGSWATVTAWGADCEMLQPLEPLMLHPLDATEQPPPVEQPPLAAQPPEQPPERRNSAAWLSLMKQSEATPAASKNIKRFMGHSFKKRLKLTTIE